MVMVRTVREHQSLYGDKPAKEVGDEYELPDNLVTGLVAAGLVVEAGEGESQVAPAKPKGKGKKG